ncbi:hypothetical protein [Coleofasciculus sp. LEGE 07092]|uniref:hypothetical protein n=1 Tax=Coleofasciculus sp. LEGE 07092 TaxID=2777969 RepID=UPI00187E2549|nr:hypothetical protein [Coleofasciculus sp. LEGE 07092]MBE9126045.1 hypothetical protein [Coleofasciculus sp. LEGE 07081]MBE9148733.1 hypothetical protein [Coleofasciculus sp. LEGE 07092]
MSDNQKNPSSTQGQSNSSQQGQSNPSQQAKVKNNPPPIKFENTVHLRNDSPT